MSIIFRNRSNQKEILDNLDLGGAELRQNLEEIERVNRLLSSYKILEQGLEEILHKHPDKDELTLVDIGCGGGDSLRHVALWSRKRGIKLKLIGIDANSEIIEFARNRSSSFPEMEYRVANVFSDEFWLERFDLAMFNLFTHHFEEEQVVEFMKACKSNKAAVLVNDLERSAWAYVLFGIMSRILGFSFISRHDGAISIKRGFRKSEWLEILKKSGFENYSVRWKWAFRHLVIAY